MQKSLILFVHGARDPDWAKPFHRLQTLTQASLPDVVVELAFLELMTPNLPQLAARQVADGVRHITVVPVFLGQGGHVRHDLPVLVEQLRRTHPQVTFQVAEAAGEDAAVLQALARYCITRVGP
ncbi:MAG: CbiX/SirB N-terminal domain-containing protein [Herbaspirillum sp.]